MTAVNVPALAEKARAATPGPWKASHWEGPPDHDGYRLTNSVVQHDGVNTAITTRADNAKFIAAASPDVVLALCEEVERLREANRVLRMTVRHAEESKRSPF